jgi:hypothetical protein
MTRRFRKSADFYFNITLIICYILFGLLLLSSCSMLGIKDEENKRVNRESCGVTATVKDLTGLDGCGKVLELEDGKRLIPFIFCGTPPLPPAEDFWLNKAKDGMKVSVSYSISEISNICMAGETVTLNCINEI